MSAGSLPSAVCSAWSAADQGCRTQSALLLTRGFMPNRLRQKLMWAGKVKLKTEESSVPLQENKPLQLLVRRQLEKAAVVLWNTVILLL